MDEFSRYEHYISRARLERNMAIAEMISSAIVGTWNAIKRFAAWASSPDARSRKPHLTA